MTISRPTLLQAVVCLGIVLSGTAYAQGGAGRQLSCKFYKQLDKQCRCPGNQNFLLVYGEKYCQRFLRATGWTVEGIKWRNRTMLCLQAELKQRFAHASSGRCDCRELRQFAFTSHVRCYTQQDASICSLPQSDRNMVYDLIDGAELFSGEGLSQFLSVALTCVWRGPPGASKPRE